MRIEGTYFLGTATELANKIAEKLTNNGVISAQAMRNFPGVDFAEANLTSDNLEEIEAGSEYWHGIKRLDTGFDNYGYDLFADYYGGGCGVHKDVGRHERKEMLGITIRFMIRETITGSIDETDVLIAQFADGHTEWSE